MNRTNSGANMNSIQLLVDALILIISCGIDFCVFGLFAKPEQELMFVILFGVFAMVMMLSNKQFFIYDVTRFYYVDRMQRMMTISFLYATITGGLVLIYFANTEENRLIFISFLVITYILMTIRVLLHHKLSAVLAIKEKPRIVYVGKPGTYDRFRYFLKKTSIQIEEIGYIASDREAYEMSPELYLGSIEELEHLVHQHTIDQIYFLQKNSADVPKTQQYVDTCIAMGVNVCLIMDLYKRRRANTYVTAIGTYPVTTYHTITLNSNEELMKRLLDIFGGIIGIILSSPIMIVTAILIKLDSPGPVVFKQTRVGKNGRTFEMYKFRSMYIDAEERKKELMAQNEIEGGVMFKMKDDPRVTRVGKIIRKLSIDELPQFFNVLGGSMSLVGTRPPTLDEVEKYKTNHWRRISIKPGLTGMWQVSGRSGIQNFEDIVGLDVEYIDKWNLLLDIKILLKTVFVIFSRKGAF